MFNKLQNRWKVSGGRLILIIATFAIGGSLCGFAGKRLMLLMGIEKGFWWLFLYILIVTLLWPISVLLIGILLGQYNFFKQYLERIYFKIKTTTKRQKSRKAKIN